MTGTETLIFACRTYLMYLQQRTGSYDSLKEDVGSSRRWTGAISSSSALFEEKALTLATSYEPLSVLRPH